MCIRDSPYTWALLSSMPQMGVKGEDLFNIVGTPPNLFAEIRGDAFAPRNQMCIRDSSGRWNALFCAARDEHFTQAASFDMGNGTVCTVWERTEPADRAEGEYYLDAFAQEDVLDPEMFSQVAEAWLAGHGL